MKQRMYLKAATAISPQQTFYPDAFLKPVVTTDNGKLRIIDPDYRPYINPVAIRRMSRLMKMAISTAMQCLKDADVAVPDAIITGTSRGSMTDMEVFMKDLIRLEEGPMNPTIFIQSTYNSPNGWIAQLAKSTAYNQTYVHRGCSLELALLDAQLIFAEANQPRYVLAGSYDEITDEYVIIKNKLHYWKAPVPHSLDLFAHRDTPGTIAGEGAAFFTLSNEQTDAHACIEDIHLIQHAEPANVLLAITELLSRHDLNKSDIGLVLTGLNGDSRHDPLYQPTLDFFGDEIPVGVFKHLCGEYDTATGFGLWLANYMLEQDSIPEVLLLKPAQVSVPEYLIFINHYITGSAVAMLLRKV